MHAPGDSAVGAGGGVGQRSSGTPDRQSSSGSPGGEGGHRAPEGRGGPGRGAVMEAAAAGPKGERAPRALGRGGDAAPAAVGPGSGLLVFTLSAFPTRPPPRGWGQTCPADL